MLSVEKIHLLEKPDAQLSCSVNVVVNCASVMKTPQASAFGFPNSFLGLMFFPIVAAFALMGLLGTKFSRYVILILADLSLLATTFSYWLFFQSVYVIQILCPWCLLVTASMTIILASVTRYLLLQNSLQFKKPTHHRINIFINKGYLTLIAAAIIIIFTILVYLKFGDSLFL